MPKCPNCDQATRRTKDWACQWCGYPLLSSSYKKIPQTYKQLKEEKLPKPEPTPAPEPASVPMPEPTPAPEATPADIELTVEELLSAYETGGTAADIKFASKILKVTGIVDRIEVKDILNIHYILLTNTEKNQLQSVRCVFNREYGPELTGLIMGQTVTVQGKYDGSIIDISMRNCVLIH